MKNNNDIIVAKITAKETIITAVGAIIVALITGLFNNFDAISNMFNQKESKVEIQLNDGISNENIYTEQNEVSSEGAEDKKTQLDELLSYQSKLKDISEQDFNSANTYFVQMISVSKEVKAKEFVDIVKSDFEKAYYEKTNNGMYKVVIEEGRGMSIVELDERKRNCDNEVNELLAKSKKGTCTVWMSVSNEYINDDIDNIKSVVEIMKQEDDETNIDKCKTHIRVIKSYLDDYFEYSLLVGQKERLDSILEGVL